MELCLTERKRSVLKLAGRLAEEFAERATFLCSEEAGYVTGGTFDVKAGLLMR